MRDKYLANTFMFICFGAAGLILLAQWQVTSSMATHNSGDEAEQPERPSMATRAPQAKLMNIQAKGARSPDALLLVDLSDRRVYLYRGHRLTASYPVAVGRSGWETPTGTFEVRERLLNPNWRHPMTGNVVPPGPNNPLGAGWIGFWSDGKNHIGFHGTDKTAVLGQAVSHGCLRMSNPDLLALYNDVQTGTPVVVKP